MLDLNGNPEDRFSRVAARILFNRSFAVTVHIGKDSL